MMKLALLVAVVAHELCFANAAVAKTAIPRHWMFARHVENPDLVDNRIKTFDFKRVRFGKNRIVDLGNGERGVWNLKENKDSSMLEMEFDLKQDGSEYILYQAKIAPGKYLKEAVRFPEDGDIYLVKGLPFPWNKKSLGKFRVQPEDIPLGKVNMKP